MKKVLTFVFCVFVAVMLVACSQGNVSSAESSRPESNDVSTSTVSSSTSSSKANVRTTSGITRGTADTVFGYPEQASVRGGTVGVFSASSDDCTVENLTTWYNQYVRHGIDDWCIINYTDKPGFGVYAGGGMVDVGVTFDSNYMEDGIDDATFYVFSAPDEVHDGKLSLIG